MLLDQPVFLMNKNFTIPHRAIHERWPEILLFWSCWTWWICIKTKGKSLEALDKHWHSRIRKVELLPLLIVPVARLFVIDVLEEQFLL